ncbi:MAG: hypothetical protein HGA78_01150 [Nitrospirales bacterium]|nr:hypothetical protein [Nitrospirales bacterium]
MEKKTYEIGGKQFIQSQLGPIQTKLLLEFLQGVKIGKLSAAGIVENLGQDIYAAAALVLRDEQGAIPWMKTIPVGSFVRMDLDQDVLTEQTIFLANWLDNKTLLTMVTDFLAVNPFGSIIEEMEGLANRAVTAMIQKKAEQTGLTSSSPSQQEEMSQKETSSPGDTPGTSSSPS